MGPLVWLLLGTCCYTVAAMLAARRGLLPDWVEVSGPITTVHTRRGRRLLDRLARHDRLFRAFGTLAVAVAFVLMALLAVVVLVVARAALAGEASSAAAQPRNVVVVPGVNDFLPLSAAPELLVGLLLALVVHEGAHGVLCRVGGIEVESVGAFLLGPLPTGAFVDPDDETAEAASPGVLNRMFAAGILTNLVVTVLAFGLLFGPVGGAISPAPGAAIGGVADGSPAAAAGIEAGDRITAVAGTSVEDADALDAALAGTACDATVELDGERETTLRRAVTVVGGDGALSPGTTVAAVDGEPVCTLAGFASAIGDSEQVTVTTGDGETRSLAVGARVTPTDGGPLADAGAPTDPVTLVRFDGERVQSTEDLLDALSAATTGQQASVVAYAGDGDGARRHEYTVTLGGEHADGGDGGLLGVVPRAGTSGLALVDAGIRTYPADRMLGLFTGEGVSDALPIGGVAGLLLVVILLPLAATVGFAPYNFAGFEGQVAGFYTVPGVPAPLDGGVFLLANVLFWTGWVNLQLALFNAIPAFPLDGGKILHTSVGALSDRVGAPEPTATAATAVATLAMLGALTAMLVGPAL
ncbi:site-2 protease family protein [Halomarina salina]|uniref:Site-2 protease family protein n=1 Tax=Halomarina salina TaxID=1872699 RepID=A0ABD5RP23_9EURY|nr:site-2 protease family protein [Halomarina salina]